MTNNEHLTEETLDPAISAARRGPFAYGQRVQVTDYKDQHYTFILEPGGYFQSRRGSFHHRELIGQPEGTVLETASGHQLLCLRPLLPDYVLSMPRGATVVYPKDSGQIVGMADVYPGARVLEAGAGSGALSLSLLAAVGESGHVHSVEKRPEFAEIARGNVYSWRGSAPHNWKLEVGDLAEVIAALPAQSVDRVILDMLAPWEHIEQAARVLEPGGVYLAYVATTTQMSRVAEALRDSGYFTEPVCSETLVRTWHVQALSVRPDHRMVAHTGFLVQARRLAHQHKNLELNRRPAPLAQSEPLQWQNADGTEETWSEADLKVRQISDKKLRKVCRDVRARYALEGQEIPALLQANEPEDTSNL